MNKSFLLLLIFFCHIIADYNLQGWLASAKQKEWWEKNAPNKLYKYDYLIALFIHSFAWSFMIMLPIAFYMGFHISTLFVIMFGWNVLLHCYIDDMKANKKAINLITDQLVHILQMIATFICLV